MMRIALLITFTLIAAVAATAQLPMNEIGVNVGRSDFPGFDEADTLGVSYNRFWGHALSSKFGLTRFSAEPDFLPGIPGELDMRVLSGELQWHFGRGNLFSPYVGGGAVYVMSSLDDTVAGDIEADNEITLIASGGLNVNITPRFAINGDVSYMPYETEFAPVILGVGMDPLTISLGAKFRW